MNTNARSLRPKIPSLIDSFTDLDLMFAVITETWFTDGETLEIESENLLLGAGISMLTRSRPPGRAGFSHGGVAILAKDNQTKLIPYPFNNPDEYEILVSTTSVKGIEGKFFIVAVYIPPGYSVPRGRGCMQKVSDIVLDIKRKFSGSYIYVAGDFNQWKIEDFLADYPELVEQISPPTRKDKRIDRTFVNFNDFVTAVSCIPPLETEDEGERKRCSDHKQQITMSSFPRRPAVTWLTITYRPFSEAAAEAFRLSLVQENWRSVMEATGSNAKSRAYQNIIDSLMDHHFPMKKIRRKSTDLPWLNDTALAKIRRKKAVFRDEGRSERWIALRDDLDEYLAKRRDVYLEKERKKMTSKDAGRTFHKNVHAYKTADRPQPFDIRDLRPGASEESIANEAAEYFNTISREFRPLDPWQIPKTYERHIQRLTPGDVATRLRKQKKPNSMVRGDLFPRLINPCADLLAVPLSNIYNEILDTSVWPISWKKEYVTIIPKKKLPTDFPDLRNISCTNFASKVFESYVLECALEEITLSNNQYGGVKKCSTAHMLIEIWQNICENAEDFRSATVLTAIDYAKAFNRLSYQECLKSLKKLGSSSTIIRLISTFLTNRTMTVRAGNAWSSPLDVFGGAPQGSILGVFLFNATIDDLENDFQLLQNIRLGRDREEHENEEPQERQAPSLLDGSIVGAGPPLTSTPSREESLPPRVGESPVRGSLYRHSDLLVHFNESTVNRPNEAPTFVDHPREEPVGTQTLEDKPVFVVKYIDDNIIVEKLNFGQTPVTVSDGKNIKEKRAYGTQNAFVSITGNAKYKGMVVNTEKTNIICVSDSLKYTPRTFIEDGQSRIESTDSLKVLGFDFTSKPNVSKHVEGIAKKLRRQFWVLLHLQKLGFTERELVDVYVSVVLPIADYCDVVYHALLTDEQDQLLERAQVGALRYIFGHDFSGRKLRAKAGIKTLRARRIEHCDSFARKCASNPRFMHWFPLKENRNTTRNPEKYQEFYARCDRLRNSPLHYMRRRLNGKDGKIYGERYRIYRE